MARNINVLKVLLLMAAIMGLASYMTLLLQREELPGPRHGKKSAAIIPAILIYCSYLLYKEIWSSLKRLSPKKKD